MKIAVPPQYSSRDACRIAGITYRQIDYWTRTNAVWPSIVGGVGSGSYRRWSARDVAALTAIARIGSDLAAVHAIPSDRSTATKIPHELVAHVWDALHEADSCTLQHGTVTIRVSIEEPAA